MFFDLDELIKDLSEDERKQLQPAIDVMEGWEEGMRNFWFSFLSVVIILIIVLL